MAYFTEKGAKDVIEKYRHLIDSEFIFSGTDKKEKLSLIREVSSVESGGYHVVFVSEKGSMASVPEFMKRNSIDYSFDDFEHL